MAVAAVMANLSRILAWWRDVDWRACAAYAVTGVPPAAAGGRTLLALPPRAVDLAIGVFLIAMIPTRRWLAARSICALTLWHLALAGAGDRLHHRHRRLHRPHQRAALHHVRPLRRRLPRHRGGGLARHLRQQGGGVPALRRALARGPLKGLIAGSSLMFGAFIAKRFVLRLPALPAGDGRHHARGRPVHAVERGIFITAANALADRLHRANGRKQRLDANACGRSTCD